MTNASLHSCASDVQPDATAGFDMEQALAHGDALTGSRSHYRDGGALVLPNIGLRVADIPMQWTEFQNVLAEQKMAHAGTWAELCEMLTIPPKYPHKTVMPLFKCATFGNLRSDNDSLRSDANMLAVYAVEGDYDAGIVTLDEAAAMLRAADIEAVLYTTARHTSNEPRWRVVAPLSAPCEPSARRGHVGVLNAALGGILASESFRASQSFYFGRLAGVEFHAAHVAGQTMDMAGLFLEPVFSSTPEPRSEPPPTEPMTPDDVHGFTERLQAAGAEFFKKGSYLERFFPLLMCSLHAEMCGHPTARGIFESKVLEYGTENKKKEWERKWAKETPRSHWRAVFNLVPAPANTADGFTDVDLCAELMKDLRNMDPERISLEWAPRAAELTETEGRAVLEEVHRRTGQGLRVLSTELREARQHHSAMLLQSNACGRRTIRHRPEMSATQAQEVAELIRTRNPLGLVRHAGRPVRIASVTPLYSHGATGDEAPEQVLVSAHSRPTLVAAAEDVALFTVTTKGGPRPTCIPHAVIDHLITCDAGLVPDISGVVSWPLVTGAGEVLSINGLHQSTGLVVHGCPEGVALNAYTKTEAAAALAWLRLHYLDGFEFASPLDADAALAGLFTAVQRPVLDMAPALAILASAQSSGKTTLARRQHLVLTGRDAPLSNLPLGNDEELEKRLLALLLTAPAQITFDNVPDGMALSLGPLNAMLTAPVLEGRILGATQIARASTASAVVITGNNLRLGADETSRTLITRLAPATVRPEARQFINADVVSHAQGIRWQVLTHVVGIVAGYLRSGSDYPTRTRFARWDVAVRQSLIWAGGYDVAEVFERNADNAEHIGALRCLLRCLHTEFESERFSVRDVINRLVLSLADVTDALEALGCRDPQKSKSVGRVLAAQIDRPAMVDGRAVKLQGSQNRDGVTVYRVSLA
ncbi:MAG TPA: hypothetical protein DET46_13515 [Comamonadaceae bacterium]|nr:hypothetical protein [Comamonadaceae bacterium]